MITTLLVTGSALAVLAIGWTIVLVANAREWRRFVREHDEAAARYESDMAAWRRRADARGRARPCLPGAPGHPVWVVGQTAGRTPEAHNLIRPPGTTRRPGTGTIRTTHSRTHRHPIA